MRGYTIGRTGSVGFTLPADAVTQKISALGRTGSGKSYAAMKLAEAFSHAGAQFFVIDPVGIWWGLRLAADQSPGIEIPLFGGLRGDIPLVPTSGALMADLIVDRRLSVILDVSQFETDRDKARFVSDFGDRFFRRMKASPSPVHGFLEECQEFIPQNPNKGEEMMLHHWTRLAKLGRNFGIGLTLISQRPQEVNKKVLNMTELLFAFQMTGNQERKTIREWLGSKGSEVDGDKITDVLRELPVGTARVSSPQWLKFEGIVSIDERWTYNSSSTPDFETDSDPIILDPLDMGELQEAMAATVKEAEANDPKKLRARIQQLEREVDVARATRAAQDPDALNEAREKGYQHAQRRCNTILQEAATELRRMEDALVQAAQRVEATQEILGQHLPAAPPAPPRSPNKPKSRPIAPPPPVRRPRTQIERDVERQVHSDLGKGEKATLIACAQYPGGVDRTQLTILTGYARSTRDTYVQRLGQRGYVETTPSGMVMATAAGLEALGDDYEDLPTGSALRAHWLQKLSGGERVILELACEHGSDGITKAELDKRTGYARSSRDTYIQRLGQRKLVTVERGVVIPSAELFDG